MDDDGNPATNFNLKEYANKKVTYWVGSFAMIFILLWLGKIKIDLTQFHPLIGSKISWSDLFYLAPGLGFEGLIFLIRWVRNYRKKFKD